MPQLISFPLNLIVLIRKILVSYKCFLNLKISRSALHQAGEGGAKICHSLNRGERVQFLISLPREAPFCKWKNQRMHLLCNSQKMQYILAAALISCLSQKGSILAFRSVCTDKTVRLWAVVQSIPSRYTFTDWCHICLLTYQECVSTVPTHDPCTFWLDWQCRLSWLFFRNKHYWAKVNYASTMERERKQFHFPTNGLRAKPATYVKNTEYNTGNRLYLFYESSVRLWSQNHRK